VYSLLPGFPYWLCLKYLPGSRFNEDAGDCVGIEGAGVGDTRDVGGLFVAALLQVRILVAPTIVILLLGRAVLDLIICVIVIKAKIVGSLVSSNFLF
jgi:hypothetical protein